jgi:hypothetical protein
LLSTAVNKGDWEKRILDIYKTWGIHKHADHELLGKRPEFAEYLCLARDTLRDWLDSESTMSDEFCVRVDPPNREQGDLVIKVLIDGLIVPDDDYCLEVRKFFSAIGDMKTWAPSTVSFLGGCGIRECCGTGYHTRNGVTHWHWYIPVRLIPDAAPIDDFKFGWTDIIKAAETIISEIERLPDNQSIYDLQDYRERLVELNVLESALQ